MIQQAYKYVSLSLWPRITFFELKITYILKSSGWGLEKSEFAMATKSFIQMYIFCNKQLATVWTNNWPEQKN